MNTPSLKSLVEQQEMEEKEMQKPKFLSREEREKLALERLEKQRESYSRLRDVQAPSSSSISSLEERMIRDRYLGENNMNFTRRTSDHRVRFDWDPSEDTSAAQDGDPLYKRSQSSDLLQKGSSLEKDKHWNQKKLEEMSERDWRIVREDYNINIQGTGHSVHPLRSWKEARIASNIMDYVEKKYKEPTPIQRQVVPMALAGIDVIGLAETGSGKTMAFLLPILSHIQNLRQQGTGGDVALNGPYALVIVPTRELAQQIELAARPILPNISLMVLVGGYRVEEQGFKMRNGAELIIGTPGRLRDFLERHLLVLNQCYHLVLDEADKMIDMNFEEDLLFLLDHFSPSFPRHTMMFSATMPSGCDKIAKGYMRKPMSTITVGTVGSAVDTVEQRVIMVGSEGEKPNLLSKFIDQFSPPIIVFVNQKKTVDYLCDRLSTFGHHVIGLHGGKVQEQREAAINQLRSGRSNILVATDVAGRGLDLPGVSLVVNYDMPTRIEEYIHRIGRTGRAGSLGVAITFLAKDDTAIYYDLKQCLQRSPRSSIPPALANHEASLTKPGSTIQKRRRDETITAFGV